METSITTTSKLTLKQIERRRADAILRVTQNALATTLAAAVPTPALELSKELGIALADAWMFWDVYKIYYNDELSADRLADLLGKAGVIVATGGVVGYGAIRLSQGLVTEILNTVPIAGWILSGLMAGSTSFSLGMFWLAFVEGSLLARFFEA